MFKQITLVATAAALMVSCAHKSMKPTDRGVNRSINAETEALVRYEYKDGEILSLCEEAIRGFRQDMEKWRNRYKANKGQASALLEFELQLANFGEALAPLTFMGSVSTDAGLREESSKCEADSSIVYNEVFTDRANYEILKDVKTTNPDEARLLKETSFAFEMNGMSLSDEKLKKFKELKDRLSQLSVQFGQNLNNDTSTVVFSEVELQGAKKDFLARLKKDGKNNFIVTTKSPDYIHIMENVSVAETRRKMMFAYNNRQAETNTPLLQEAIQIRGELGQLMGFASYADYDLREKMAGSSKAVFEFLNGLKGRLAAKNRSDLKALAEFKKKVLRDNSPLNIWDVAYLSNQLKIQKYNVDEDKIREYFPSNHVVEQTLDIYSQLLSLKFRQVKNAPVWASNVELYEVTDAQSKEVIAYFYSDLIPREGKYGHAAAFTLFNGRQLSGESSRYRTPVSAIVANFTPSAPGKPVLLSHDEVETFFHEFGHIMHQILTKARYASLSGTAVKRDFVETPSQMFENWVWQKDMLNKLSQHYQDKQKTLPADMIERMQRLRLFNSGIQYTRQLVFGLFDMNIHTNPKLDVTEEYARVHQELVGLPAIEGSHFPATFGHMMGGYSAGYYGYLWSKVFAEDMFSVFLRKGTLNPKVGIKYRKDVLGSGNMRDPMDLIRSFLGRSPNNRAFFKSLGV